MMAVVALDACFLDLFGGQSRW